MTSVERIYGRCAMPGVGSVVAFTERRTLVVLPTLHQNGEGCETGERAAMRNV